MSLTENQPDTVGLDHRVVVRECIPFFILLLDHITVHLYDWCRSTASISGQHMSASRMIILRFLEDKPGAQLSSIAAHLDVKNPTMSGLVNRLEADGYLNKTRDPDNLKRVKIYNTKKATNLLDIYHRSLMKSLLLWLGGMSENDLSELVDALEIVAKNIGLDELPIVRNNRGADVDAGKLEALLSGIRNEYDANIRSFCREVSNGVVSSRLQVRTITYTYVNPGASLVEVSEYLGVRTPTAASTVKLLEREGLLKRMAADKGNKISLSSTEKARELVVALRDQSFSLFHLALSENLSPGHYVIMRKAINCIYASPSMNQKSAKAVIGFAQADL